MACDEWRGDRVELIEEKDRLRLLYYSDGKLGWQRDFEKKEKPGSVRSCVWVQKEPFLIITDR